MLVLVLVRLLKVGFEGHVYVALVLLEEGGARVVSRRFELFGSGVEEFFTPFLVGDVVVVLQFHDVVDTVAQVLDGVDFGIAHEVGCIQFAWEFGLGGQVLGQFLE